MVSNERVAQMIRVNHAGEYGAKQIYKGQIQALKNNPKALKILQEMATQEEKHLKGFEALIIQRRIRPTFLQPVWHVAGYSLGLLSGLMGEKVAHACTIAIEEVIEEHYENQLVELQDNEPDLMHLIKECQQDEIKHKHHAEAQGGREAPLYPLLTSFIKAGSRLAIFLSQRV